MDRQRYTVVSPSSQPRRFPWVRTSFWQNITETQIIFPLSSVSRRWSIHSAGTQPAYCFPSVLFYVVGYGTHRHLAESLSGGPDPGTWRDVPISASEGNLY